MKIKDFIKELEKYNPEAEIFTEDDVNFFHAVTGRLIDYSGDNRNLVIEQESLAVTIVPSAH